LERFDGEGVRAAPEWSSWTTVLRVNKGGHQLKDYTEMDSTRQAAYLCFGDPGFWDFLTPVAKAFKSVAPIISTATSFIPFAGPLISRAVDMAAGMVPDDGTGPNSSSSDTDSGDDSL
jgi:hypothetical protein